MSTLSPGPADPAALPVADGVASCEHCRTVTWAGIPACDCEFGKRAVDEPRTEELYQRGGPPR
jgi:hypothetical protein